MKVLAIESTCDETSAAVVETTNHNQVKVLSNIVASSAEIHVKYGGVVPEVAAREQIKSIIPVVSEAILKANTEIDAIAVSYGPGLMGSLLIGVETAKTLSWLLNKPLIKVNHMSGHIMANWIASEKTSDVPEFPVIGVVVSGGHTDILYIESFKEWSWVGGTRDDAAGEAYDKAAKALNLPYPGGPSIDSASQKITDEIILKYKKKFILPRPLLHEDNLELSFSGLKSALVRICESRPNLTEEEIQFIAWEFNEAVIEVLMKKTLLAVEKYKPKSVVLAGGVAANKKLRERMSLLVKERDISFFVPELKYCGDNAAMIGSSGILKGEEADLDLRPVPSLETVK